MLRFTYSERSKPLLNFEGYNHQVGNIFPTYSHIYRFIELLRAKHASQQYKAEETFVHMRKPRKISDTIGVQLVHLLEQYIQEEISDLH